jgi:curved DNA-binding protein CbpA
LNPLGCPSVNEQTPPLAATGAKRRSTRLDHTIPVMVSWLGSQTEPRLERTATLSINCHGFRYFSRYTPRKNSKISVQLIENKEDNSLSPSQVAARVAWTRKSRRMAGLYQVGVEFEAPQNLWKVDDPPEDWESFPSASMEDPESLLAEADRLLRLAQTGTHYQLLQLEPAADRAEVKKQFYQLARRFHPDRHMDRPECAPRLQLLMDALTTAYKVLSSDDAKARYDAEVLQVPDPEQQERQRLAQEFLGKARECLAEGNYIGSILWLRRAIENEPQSSGYRTMLAESLAQVPEYRREAAEQFEIAIELDPRNLTAHLRYAYMLEKVKMPWRARPHYVCVLELEMNHPEARARLAFLDAIAPRNTSRSSLLGRLTGRHSR